MTKRNHKFGLSDRVIILRTGETATIKSWDYVGGQIKAKLEMHNGTGVRHKTKDEIQRIK